MINSVSAKVIPSFKGIYVVEGKGRDVAEFDEMMCDLNLLDKSSPLKLQTSINDYNSLYITGLYGDEQPCAQLLVTTNEDTKALANWHRKYTAEDDFFVKTLEEKISFLEDKINEYTETETDTDKEIDFVLKRKKEAMAILEQMKEFTAKKIETFKFADVMKGFMEGTFCIMEGKFKI